MLDWESGQTYYENGTWNDGKKDGPWVGYNKDGTVNKKYTGTYKDGVKIK